MFVIQKILVAILTVLLMMMSYILWSVIPESNRGIVITADRYPDTETQCVPNTCNSNIIIEYNEFCSE